MHNAPENNDAARQTEEILRLPNHAMKNRATLRLLFGRGAKVDQHFEAMVEKTRRLPYIADNPDLAPWIYAWNFRHKRDFHNNLGSQQVVYGSPSGAPMTTIIRGNQTFKIPRFLQLSYVNNSGTRAQDRHIYECTPSAASAKTENVTPEKVTTAIKEARAAAKTAAGAKAAHPQTPQEPSQTPPKKESDPPKAIPQPPANEPSPPPRDTKKKKKKKKKPGPDDQLNLF